MLIFNSLFEFVMTQTHPQTGERDHYVGNRVQSLRRQIGKKGVSAKDVNAQIQDYQKRKFVTGMGTTQW